MIKNGAIDIRSGIIENILVLIQSMKHYGIQDAFTDSVLQMGAKK